MSANVMALPVLDAVVRLELERQRSQRPVRLLLPHATERRITLRRAAARDARGIHALTEQFVGDGLLLPRSYEQVCRTIRDYVIAVENGRVVACGALRIYSPELAEVGALAVAAHCQGLGLGRHVVEALMEDARALGITRAFALTMQVQFFGKVGFEPVSINEFPAKIAADCNNCSRRETCAEVAVARYVISN